MQVCSSSGTGKTTVILELIKRRTELHCVDIKQVLYVYSEWQSAFESADPIIEFVSSISDIKDKLTEFTLVVIDDSQTQLQKEYNEFVTELFTKRVHHGNFSVILLLQNAYGKNMRVISLNTKYLLMGPFYRDRSVITTIARQIRPDNIKFIQYVYNYCMKKPFSFVFFDFCPNTHENMRIRSSIFPEEALVFLPL